MPGLLTWVLVGIVLYTAVAMGLRAQGYLPESVKVSGPLTTVHTKRGRQVLNKLASRKRFWRAWGNLGVGIAIVVMVITGLGVLISVPAIIAQPEAGTLENPQNVLVIPGVNDFLPLSAAPEIVFGLLVGLVVHEGGHGLLCRVENIDIESMGIATFALIPIGAFVEPDADHQREADRGAQSRMFAAGITNNFAVCVVAILLLIPLAGAIGVVAGAPVGDTVPGSSATDAGIESGDVITGIDGVTVDNASHLDTVLEDNPETEIEVERKDSGAVEVDRRLLVLQSVQGVADDIVGTDPLTRVTAVNGTDVSTERAFATAVQDQPVTELTTADRGNETLPIGAYIAELPEDSALAQSENGAPSDGTPLIVTRLADRRVSNASGYESVRDTLEAGDSVSVEAYIGGERQTFNATVDSDGRLGVPETVLADGYSGLVFDDFGVDPYPAEQFLSFLSGSNAAQFPAITSVLAYMANLLVLPFATLMDPSFSYNFAGFTGDITGFFVVEGPFSVFGGGVFLAVNLLFWSWWVNFNLALFNCIPAFPLDGGHILRASTESIMSRLPVPRRRLFVTLITGGITVGMVFAVLLLVFAPVLL